MFCSTLNLGSTMKNIMTIMTTMTSSATPTVHDSETLVFSALMMAPMPIIGAKHASLRVSTVVCCTICTSLVDLVISDAVENCSSSAAENDVTFSKSDFLISLDD